MWAAPRVQYPKNAVKPKIDEVKPLNNRSIREEQV